MIVYVDYASPSVFESTRDAANVSFAANARRPVRFRGSVRREYNPILRFAMRALGEAIWSADYWASDADCLDPVITIHRDRIFMEAFSQDQSAYVSLVIDPEVFEIEGEVATGTTNIDFTAWLWGALGEMRSSRKTRFDVGPEGFETTTAGAGGRFEKKVELPESWVRGFLQAQAAIAMPGTRLAAKPVDLLSAIRFLRHTNAKLSPRALRYEFEPGQDARLVIEPFEHVVRLEGARHDYAERKVTRVWGRRRLRLIEGLLPFAQSVDIYLKGRALPSFYAVKLPGMTFLLGLTGWSGAAFTSSGGFDLLAGIAKADDGQVEKARALLAARSHMSIQDTAAALATDNAAAARVLARLCRMGLAMFDVETRRYRHRELFETPVDEARYFPPDPRREAAERLLEAGDVEIVSAEAEDTVARRRLRFNDGETFRAEYRTVVHRDWRIVGRAGDASPVEIVVDAAGRIIFGRCTCAFSEDNLLNIGPCEHMLALSEASEDRRRDGPVSAPIVGNAHDAEDDVDSF